MAFIATEKLPVPAIRGGAIQIYLEAIAPRIAQEHDVTVISIKDPNLKKIEKIDNVRYVRFSEDVYVESIKEFLRNESFHLIHICNRPRWVSDIMSVIKNSKCVLSVHNEMFATEKITDEDGLKCINTTSKIVTVSDFIGRTITSRFPMAKEKVQTVYSGVDLEKYIPAWTNDGIRERNKLRKQLGLENKKIVLFVGRLSKVKGPHILLQALPEIINKHSDVMLIIVGSKWFGDNDINNYVKHLYTIGALKKDNVMFIKFIKPSDIPLLYTMSDIFVCSSQWEEPLARVHFEAMAAGIPILTSNRGGNPEVIEEGKNGFIIEAFENPNKYASEIIKLLDDKQLRDEIGRYGRELAEKKYGWDNVVHNLLRVYKSVVEN